MESNRLGSKGGAAIAEALKVNETITTIKYVPPAPRAPPPPRLRFVTYGVTKWREG